MRRGTRAFAGALGAALAVSLLGAATASATFHLMKVREVSAGSAANESYVELQMYAPLQQFLSGHQITLYDGTGVFDTFTFPASPVPSVPNGISQATILVGDTSAAGSPDFTDASLTVNAAAGAACFDAIPPDCVSWGTGTSAALPAPGAGSPAPAIASGMALRRSISPGCPTLLEAGDDTDNSAADFSLVASNPRSNSVPPMETPCTPSGGGGGPPGGGPAASPKKKCKKHKRRAAAAKKCKKRK